MSFAVTNRQVGWVVFAGLAGFFIGGKAGSASGAILGTAWGGSIGYGVASILGQKQATKWVLIHWVATLALFWPLPAILSSYASPMVAGTTAAVFGALLGLLAGTLHLWRLRRKP